MNVLKLSVFFCFFLGQFSYNSEASDAAKKTLVKDAWIGDSIEVIQFDLLRAHELGLGRNMQGLAWRKAGEKTFYPLYDLGTIGRYTGGLNIEKITTCPSPLSCAVEDPIDRTLEVSIIKLNSNVPGAKRAIMEAIDTGLFRDMNYDFSKPILVDEARIRRGDSPTSVLLNPASLEHRAQLERDIFDRKTQVEEFLSRSRVLYYMGKTKDNRFSFAVDLSYPSREEDTVEFLVKDNKKGSLHKFKGEDIQAAYVTGDGNIYVRGRSPQGINFELYVPTDHHAALVKELREKGELPSAQMFLSSKQNPKSEVFEGPGKMPQHFLYSLGEKTFFRFGTEQYKENQILELSDGSKPYRLTASTSNFPQDSPEKERIYNLMGSEMGVNWRERYLGEGLQTGPEFEGCNSILSLIN